MRFDQITVYIDYRFKAGDDKPKNRSLRARVKMGSMLGKDLTPQWIKDVDCIKHIAAETLSLQGVICDTILFEIDPIVGAASSIWVVGSKLNHTA